MTAKAFATRDPHEIDHLVEALKDYFDNLELDQYAADDDSKQHALGVVGGMLLRLQEGGGDPA